MTQEHREQFLATEGWQKTERGHIRVERFERVPDEPFIPHGICYVVTSIQPHPSRKFRRFPFGRQPKHDALMGWFVTGDDMAGGTLTEQWQIAFKASEPGISVERWQRLLVDFWIEIYPRNKRQGWKTIEVNGEKVVVEVMG